jgi:hypothetical protein
MRKIDKTTILSTDYKKWEEALPESHPKYNSSKNQYYYDIVMNLFHCQKGLCAYTEMLLCEPEPLEESIWENEKYPYPTNESLFNGQLDHYDSTKKISQAWLWDNLFMVDSDTNRRKGTKDIEEILKPDRQDYNPFDLLEYNSKLNIFLANTDLDEDIQEKINYQLKYVLGINHPVVVRRRRAVGDKIDSILFGSNTWETVEITEFPTAFEFCKREILKQL